MQATKAGDELVLSLLSFAQVSGHKLYSGSYDKTIRIWDIKPLLCVCYKAKC